MKKFSIIVPTLNEEDNIAPLLKQIDEATRPLGMSPEIIFVDDGSTDQTRQKIDAYSGDMAVRLIRRDTERGLAGAVVAGAHAASYDQVVVMDADLSHPPKMAAVLFEKLVAGKYDMVIGSRYVRGGQTPGWPMIRRLGSRLASLPAQLLTSVHDPLSGFFAIDRDRLRALAGNIPGFKIGLEILAGTHEALRVLEVPITFSDRHRGDSKMSAGVFKEYLSQLGGLFFGRALFRDIPLLLCLGIIAGILDYTFLTLLIGWGMRLEAGHMLSLLLATHACILLLAVVDKEPLVLNRAGLYLRFFTIAILGVFLRGGLSAFAIVTDGPPQNLPPIMIGITSCLTWLAAIIALRLDGLELKRVNWKIFGSLLLAYSILLRLVYLGSVDLIQEEAYYWNYAQHPAAGYLDHPPVVALLIKLGTLVFGQGETGIRFGALICWCITAVFTYRLTKTIFNKDIAFRALLLVATLPVFFGVGFIMTPDAPLIACWAGTLYFLYHALVLGVPKAWLGAGLCLGIGLASKYSIAFLGPAVLLYMVIEPSARKWFLRPQPYLAALLALMVFSPVIWWNYQNHWASFLFQSQGRFQAESVFSTHRLLLSILLLITPTGIFAAIVGMWPKQRGCMVQTPEGTIRQRGYLFCLMMALIPLSIFLLFSFTKEIKLNWTGPLWLVLLPFMAAVMVAGTGRMQNQLARLWPGTLVALVLIYGALLHYCTLGLPGVAFAKSDFLFGWDDLAQKVEEHVQTIATARHGKRPLVVGMDTYRTASGLAFYRSKLARKNFDDLGINDTTGYHLFGQQDLMYSYWFPTKSATGRDILVVSEDEGKMDPAYFVNYGRHLGRVFEITVEKRGKEAGRFYVRALLGYTPDRDR